MSFSLGFICPLSFNPADFYIKVVFDKSQNTKIDSTSIVLKPFEKVHESFYYKPLSIEFNESFNCDDYKVYAKFTNSNGSSKLNRLHF